ncbi:hypothetical protein, partial [Streptomyces sp. GbtcB6]|uniref:hypothetical protein n=1 Tax=Streptomyces sp. GbtcB6 TaxID=2824751 RepID=UPI001C302D20
MAHDAVREAVPDPVRDLVLWESRRWATEQPPHRKCLDPGAEDGEQGGQHGQCRHHRHHDRGPARLRRLRPRRHGPVVPGVAQRLVGDLGHQGVLE